jgi:protocatechuate 3,4-dioxygenase beta subunit
MVAFVKNTRMVWIVSALVLLCGVISVRDLAASERGVVVGAVADTDGGPLPGARIEIDGPNRPAPEKSGGMGFFLFTGLAAGEYTVTVSHPDFGSAAQRVLVRPGQTTTMSVQLRAAHR